LNSGDLELSSRELLLLERVFREHLSFRFGNIADVQLTTLLSKPSRSFVIGDEKLLSELDVAFDTTYSLCVSCQGVVKLNRHVALSDSLK
jgi:hypothetical protein